ncbi:MAG: class I SAM-dependent methyltransferase [Chthoniobacterales bacterium]|nr:class I SAM-dependent methyltransferase [Chthoniobacterales bacterium]
MSRKGVLERRVRQSYEKIPYPKPGRKTSRAISDSLVPLPWLEAFAGRTVSAPRILVAGCGTGAEAIFLGREFRAAEVLGIDFSQRSIRYARRALKQVENRPSVKFICGDLTDSKLMRQFANSFDLVWCHGVLSYVPKPVPVLRNLARCLKPDGLFYLGVNGPAHFSAHYRPATAAVGLDPGRMPSAAVRKTLLSFCDALTSEGLAKLSDDLLSSDLFAPFMNNLALSQWVGLACQAGLQFRGEYGAYRRVLRALGEITVRSEFRCSRAELHHLTRLLVPPVFNRILFTFAREPTIDWSANSLMTLRPRLTNLYAARQSGACLRLTSNSLKHLIEIEDTRWEAAFLRCCDGSRTARQILRQIPQRVSRKIFRQHLYLFYQAAVLGF